MSQANRIDKDNSDNDNSSEYEMYRVSSGSSKPPVNLEVEMEVDTGASVSLISEEKLHQLQGKGTIALRSSKAKLFSCPWLRRSQSRTPWASYYSTIDFDERN